MLPVIDKSQNQRQRGAQVNVLMHPDKSFSRLNIRVGTVHPSWGTHLDVARAVLDPRKPVLRLLLPALIAFGGGPYALGQTRSDASSVSDYRAQLQPPADISTFGTAPTQRPGREWTVGLRAAGSLIFTDNVA